MVDINIFIINICFVITFLYCTFIYFIPAFVLYFFFLIVSISIFVTQPLDLIIRFWFIRLFSSISHISFSIHKSCTIFPIPFSTPFSSSLNKHSNGFMYSLFSHFLLGFFDVLVFDSTFLSCYVRVSE